MFTNIVFYSAIGFQDLPIELQKEVLELQKSMAIELQPLVLESQLTMQKILECPNHQSRVELVRTFVESEKKRLRTKRTLKSMFGGASESTVEESDESIEETESASEQTTRSSSFFVDDDSFQ